MCTYSWILGKQFDAHQRTVIVSRLAVQLGCAREVGSLYLTLLSQRRTMDEETSTGHHNQIVRLRKTKYPFANTIVCAVSKVFFDCHDDEMRGRQAK